LYATEGKTGMTESRERNGVEHVPSCSTWPPPWLTPAAAAAPNDSRDAAPEDDAAAPWAGDAWEHRRDRLPPAGPDARANGDGPYRERF
jgi:hypothetical protein